MIMVDAFSVPKAGRYLGRQEKYLADRQESEYLLTE